jgi:hypothetical protein
MNNKPKTIAPKNTTPFSARNGPIVRIVAPNTNLGVSGHAIQGANTQEFASTPQPIIDTPKIKPAVYKIKLTTAVPWNGSGLPDNGFLIKNEGNFINYVFSTNITDYVYVSLDGGEPFGMYQGQSIVGIGWSTITIYNDAIAGATATLLIGYDPSAEKVSF